MLFDPSSPGLSISYEQWIVDPFSIGNLTLLLMLKIGFADDLFTSMLFFTTNCQATK